MDIKKSAIWGNFVKIEFKFEGRNAVLVLPDENNRTDKWILKTEYFEAFPNLQIEMLKRGYHVAYVENITRWCKPEDTDCRARFAEFLSKEFELNKKCVPVGMSCGGMQAVYFAAKYPQYVAALYLDAPVMNLLSCPAGMGIAGDDMWEEFQTNMGMTKSELICYRNHPIDNMKALLDNNIPIFLVCGDSDKTVPYCENGEVLDKYYRENGGDITTIVKVNCDHHPHGLEDNTPIVDFIFKNY